MKIPDEFDSAAASVAGGPATNDPLDKAAAGVVQGQRTALRTSLYGALMANPDMAARAQKLGRQTGLPADVVERNMPEVQRTVQLDEFDQVLKNSPTVAQWLTDQNNAKVAHDDVDNMSGIESALRYLVSAPGASRGGLMSYVGKAGMAGVSGLQRASAGVVGIGQAGFDLAAPMADPLVGRILPGNPLRAAAEGLAQYRQSIEGLAKANMPKTGGIIESGVMSGFSSLASNLAALPMALLPGGQAAALTAMTAPVSGQAYGEARDKGQGVVPALGFGASQAAIEYATEKLPVSWLLKDLKAGAGFGKVLAHQAVSELPGEQVATALQDLNEWAVLNPDKPFKSYLAERPAAAAQTLIATLVGTGGNVAVVKGIEAMTASTHQQMRIAQQAEQNATVLDQLRELATASKLRERDPQSFQQFVEQASQDGPVQDVYIDAKTFAQAATDAGLTPEQLPPSVADQLESALVAGGDLRIPVGEFAAQIAPTEYAQGLMDHLKTDPQAMTRAEAKVYMQSYGEELKAQVEKLIEEKGQDLAFNHSISQVKATFHDQLNTANRFTPEVNNAYASMLSNFYGVQAAKLGITPEAMLERYPLRIQAEGVQAAVQQFDQDGPFGQMLHDFKGNAQGAIAKLMELKSGEAIGALHHPEIGDIDLVWGSEGTGHSDGYGLAKIAKFHPEVLNDLQGTLSAMKVTTRSENRINLESDDHRAGVRLTWDNQAKHWLVTAFEKKKRGVTSTTSDTASLGGKDDTARLPNASDSIVEQTIQKFYQDNPNILNQAAKDERDLVVTHNLTADNLLHAQKMGGIAVPSLAITKKNNPLTGFGEITLIGDPKMADPKGYAATKVFGADIYSPRYPKVERDLDKKGQAALDKQFRPMAERMGVSLPGSSELQRDAQHELERNLAVMGQFLRDQGIEPTLVYRPGMKPEREARLVEFGLGQFLDVTDIYALRNDPVFFKAALAEMIDTYESLDGKRDAFVQKLKTDEDAQRNMVRDTAYEVANAAKMRQRPEVDSYETRKALEAQVSEADLGNAFQQYVAELLDGITKSERIFQGFTNSGNRKYIPHSLENVVKLLKKELRGGESLNYGVGSLRAQFTPQFKSVAQIKANKDRLISAEQFEGVKKEIDAEFLAVVADINPNLSLDTGVSIMEDAAKNGAVRAAKDYGYEIGDVTAERVSAFLEKLRNLPTAYFEAKILREVDLAEFAGAVVPEGVNPEVIKTLEERGVKDIKFYRSGDEADRAVKIGGFDHLFFQGNRGQIAFGQDITKQASVITLLKNADLSTFLHEAGHFFLEVQFDLAARIAGEAAMFGDDTNKPGEQQVLADTAELMRWFGVNSIEEWFGLPEEQKRSYHEQFARGFEAYLFEGKAPSIEMQGIFQRFRAWMLKVYKDLKNLNVELTDEVRGVMDRMLATTEQIQLAEQGRSMMPLFTSAQQAGMTPEEFADYQAMGMDATQSAVEDLQARTLRDMQWMANAKGREIKKLQKQSTARRSEMMIEARREIMSQPVYRAWQFLTGKLSKDDKAAVTPDPVPKSKAGPVDPAVDSLFVAIAKLGGLDRDQVGSQWGLFKDERSPQPLFGKPLLRREGGLSLDAMGEALAEEGYLPKDEHGKFDPADLEGKFDAEYRGDTQYSVAFEYAAAANGEKRAGEDADLENLGAGRLDLRAMKDLGIPDEIVEHIVNLKMTAKDGIDPDLVATEFGFTSGDELVRTLAAAQAPKVAIQELTDQKMLERFGELSSPEAIASAADAALHNDVRARFVASELNALAKATGKPKVLASAAREYAKAMIDRLLVRNIKPTQYAMAEARAAKASDKAIRAGDTEQAAVEKRNQLISSYATKAAYDAQDEIEKALRYLGKFERAGIRKSIDTDYLDQIDSILERFDLRTGQSLKSIDKRKALADWIGAQEELGIEVELPEKIRAEAFRQSYKELTVEEMRGLVDSIKQIEHLGRLKEKLLTAADNRRFADIVASMVASIEEHAGDKRANNRTRDTMGNRALRLFTGFVASHRKTASLARELDGFQDAGPMWTYLIQSMNTAGDREATMRAEATTRLAEMLKPVLAEGRMGKKQFIAEINDSLTRGEQIVVALNMGNAGNIQRLVDGRMWTGEQIGAVVKNLSSADWQFVQKVWDFFESYRPQIAAKERRVMGKEPNWVEPQALTVHPKGGVPTTLRGGYFPIVYDARESGSAERQADAEAAKQMMKGAFVAATTRRSFTKTRAEEVSGRPLLLTWDALFRGANDVIHDLAWHEWVIDANRIVKNDQVDKAIRNTYGADVIQQFKAAIRDVAAGDAPNMDALSKVMTPLRSGAAVAGLGFNLMNALLQPLGLTQSMVRVGAKWVGMGIAEWAKSPVGLVTRVNEKSEFMRNRSRTQQRELNEIQSVVQGKSEVREKIDALMFMPMQSLQLIADIPTWWGAYQKALAEVTVGMDEEVADDLAVKLADQAVIDAQGGGQVKDLALIQRGGPMQKLFTVFYGFFSTAYNLGVERAKETNYRSPLEVMHLAGDFLLLYSVPAVLASLLKEALTPGGGDDPEKLARKLIGEQISYLMGLMVGVREMTGAVQYVTGTKQFDTSYGGPAGLRFFQELEKLAKQVNQGDLDRALARSVVNVGGVLLALPSAQVNRTIDGVVALQEGKTDNPAALLFGYDKGK